MILKSLRFLEYVFAEISYYFENLADRYDKDLHNEMRNAMQQVEQVEAEFGKTYIRPEFPIVLEDDDC